MGQLSLVLRVAHVGHRHVTMFNEALESSS